ncbi:PREDICTED: U2 snRNP-associated SURP motif-containing protein isoform X2 [Nicrophorus vespilloides]|uniref:U2 snRNP-associated SURP motif-containing protein isoform X2 n=1 Tax=Nicrophorus vespilloides TaxID=110193 RepID=A0ABM1MVU9_NICVS|nr:PREDICTED: U2 snRNP-associated SURP motif-containing protein isoform X2 [Nicrophorus vespilloides]
MTDKFNKVSTSRDNYRTRSEQEHLQHIPQQKLRAFSIGAMGKRNMSKRELEEQRKKEEDRAAADAFKEFVETFQETPINGGSKVWVKAGTYDAGARREDTREKGKLYKPQSRLVNHHDFNSAEQAQAYAKLLAIDRKPERLGKRKQNSKSNLESFKEELRQIQEEREERHKYKGILKSTIESDMDIFLKAGEMGSFDNGDPTTTNLYLGNLNPKKCFQITEQQLMEIFGRYGPLASIKIMWPRSDEEKSRGRNCGFVAYMSRRDGERALRNLNGKDVLGYEMKLGWGKSVVIPPHPIYIPPSLLELSFPPPPSGLPFNAQPLPKDKDVLPKSLEELNGILRCALVKVVIPTDRTLLMLIHRMVEFVVREGPMFEAMIMNRELHNPLFRFLFENQSPAHIYYRWKIFSIMHGDSQKEWTTREFRMFKDGSPWKPPVMNNYTAGMPEELIVDEEDRSSAKGTLSNTQRDRLEDLIRNLSPERRKIGEVMVFCIEHSEAAEEIADCVTESLSNLSTVITKKIARLYLINDILHNCAVKVTRASSYRRAFESRLLEILKHIKRTYDRLDGRLKADGFRMRVMRVLKAWEDLIYPKVFMDKLVNVFLGLEGDVTIDDRMNDVDGCPVDGETDEDVPMDGAALLKSALKQQMRSPSPIPSDYDGVVIDDSMDKSSDTLSGFISSKWETVDPEQVAAQAITTSKWDMVENSGDNSGDSSQADKEDSMDFLDSRTMTEERRTKLREIEVKAMQYQDELESGSRSIKSGWTVSQQVEHYRRKLLRKSEKERKDKDKEAKSSKHKRNYESDKASSSDEEYYKEVTSRKHKKHARSSSSGSTSRYRSKSRSPPRKKSSRAPSPPSPPRIRRRSPSSSRSSRYVRSPSPGNGKYVSKSSNRYSPYSKYERRTPSPKSPYTSTRSRNRSPDSKKHRHKHKY